MSDDAPLAFVDTNILIYAYDRSADERHAKAKMLIAELWKSRRGCLSVQVLQEFYVVGARKLIQTSSAELRTILSDLTLWRVHTPAAPDVLAAINLHQQLQVSFWDAMILQSATQLGCPVLWLEDLNPGQVYQGVRVLNPFSVNTPS